MQVNRWKNGLKLYIQSRSVVALWMEISVMFAAGYWAQVTHSYIFTFVALVPVFLFAMSWMYFQMLYDIRRISLSHGTVPIYIGHQSAFVDLFKSLPHNVVDSIFLGGDTLVAYRFPDDMLVLALGDLTQATVIAAVKQYPDASYIRTIGLKKFEVGIISSVGYYTQEEIAS